MAKTTLEQLTRRSIRQLVTAWTPGIKTTWTVAEVRSALALHRQGDFSQSALLVDAMGEDDAISSVLEKRVDALLQSDFSLNPAEHDNEKLATKIAEELEPCWWDYFPESELDDLLRWYRMLGVGIGVLDWTTTSNSWDPSLRVLHPQYLRHDEERDKFYYYAREGELEVTPGDGRWVMLIDGRRGWMRGSVRPMAIPWIARQFTLRDWNRYNERHGFPLIKAKAPAIADDADRDQFWEDIESLQSEAVAQLITHLDETGAEFDLDLLEATDKSYDSFKLHLEYIDRRITVHFLGGNLSTEIVDQGARAASDTHHGVEREKASADNKKVSTALRKQAVAPTVVFNYQGADATLAPWPEWDTSPPSDDAAEADAAKKFGEAITAIQGAGYDVENVDELAEKHGLKLVKRPEPPPPAPEQDDDEGIEENDGEPENDGNEGRDPERGSRRGKDDNAGATTNGGRGDQVRGAPGGSRRETRAEGNPVLASGDSPQSNAGFLSGQLYADALVDAATDMSQVLLGPTMQAVQRAMKGATDYESLRENLRSEFAGLEPEKLMALTHQVLGLANFAGRAAVNEDQQ